MKTPIHSININVNTYTEAKELFDYATRKASKTNSSFWLHVRNQSLEAMNLLKEVEGE
ncbi:hypothetical protein [Vibrio coralliirubri]|uniref:hypothetical protein n=1 Tax=Vibrio coralliirubri TaxID=1516159 RepID=UPI0012FF62D9|nr:hypothetical protein [Vibrio coralliirubri]|tara:strand:+ start:453 stop:626 length:174 start_codon:yes stop_codon:yes gene_type:complete